MANQFVSLPAPAANAAGAAVDMSTFGATKTITVTGNGGVFEPFATIEISNQIAPTKWAPIWTFQSPGEKTFEVACLWMRVSVSNYKGGGAQTIDVGGTDDTVFQAVLVPPAGNGAGVGVNTAPLPLFKTIQVAGPFRGALNVEISEDGGATYSTLTTFYSPGQRSLVTAAQYMRVSRNGVPTVNPGLPSVEISAVDSGSGGGGGGGNEQAFLYTATGAEGDSFDIPLPALRASTAYIALVGSAGQPGGIYEIEVPVSGYTTSSIHVNTGTPVAAGDVFAVFVRNRT